MRIRQKWSAPAELASVGRLRRAVGSFAADGGISGVALDHVRLCMSEALTNAVVHACRDGRAAATITVSAEFALDGLVVTVNDDGIGFHPDLERLGLGLGLRMINAITDWMWIGNSSTGGTEIGMAFAQTAPTLPTGVDASPGLTADLPLPAKPDRIRRLSGTTRSAAGSDASVSAAEFATPALDAKRAS